MDSDPGPTTLAQRLTAVFRRTGADLPGGDPRPTHGASMEGWFWRFTDEPRGTVVLALCGVNRHPDGDWATVAVSAHPGGVVRSAAVDDAHADADHYRVVAGSALVADEHRLRVDLGDVRLDVTLDDLVGWPMRLGAGGIFSAVPGLGQYWHPHVLDGRAHGTLVLPGTEITLDASRVYAEKNWGAGFPDRWWWGQAQGFRDPTITVAFGGGRLTAGPFGRDITGCVVRLGPRVLRFSPPGARVRIDVRDGHWHVDARRRHWRMVLDGGADGTPPAILPVPLPAERRNVNRDFEHLAGRLRVRLWHCGGLVVDDESRLAALEVGTTDLPGARALAADFGAAESGVD
ncbi:MAG: tocopherol cyclase family protein [Actinomycetota bacterium]